MGDYYVTQLEIPIGQYYHHQFETFYNDYCYTYTLVGYSNNYVSPLPVLPVGLKFNKQTCTLSGTVSNLTPLNSGMFCLYVYYDDTIIYCYYYNISYYTPTP
uniref:Uncharacterized protein n=1 Tax=viral metagenome TaxID=1070528 RepID=A0A6C0DI50_9ZZZZ